MRKLILTIPVILISLAFCAPSFAATQTLKWGWEYDETEMNNVAKFVLAWGMNSKDYSSGSIDILPSDCEQTTDTPIAFMKDVTHTVSDNQDTTLYFAMKAVDDMDISSDWSNEVVFTFEFAPLPAPTNLHIIIERVSENLYNITLKTQESNVKFETNKFMVKSNN